MRTRGTTDIEIGEYRIAQHIGQGDAVIRRAIRQRRGLLAAGGRGIEARAAELRARPGVDCTGHLAGGESDQVVDQVTDRCANCGFRRDAAGGTGAARGRKPITTQARHCTC